MITVGVTGNIGSGKTEVCRIFQGLGAKVIFADELAKQLMETRPILARRLRETFGNTVFAVDGKLDRELLARIAFGSKAAKETLDAIVHPYVLRELRRIIREERKQEKTNILVVEAALIFESGAERLLDYVVVVHADENVRLARVIERDGSSREQVLARARWQMTSAEKKKRADFVVHNDGSREELMRRIRFVYDVLSKMNAMGERRTQ